MVMYNIKFKTNKAIRTTARYGNKRYVKGKTYTIRRKLTPTTKKDIREVGKIVGYKILSIRKIKRKWKEDKKMTDVGDMVGGLVGLGIGLAIIDRISPPRKTRVKYRTVYRKRKVKRRKKRKWWKNLG